MSVYLETNALRKLTNYECEESVYTSIFAIFELLAGITKEDFEIRKACLKRIEEQKIEIRGPMVDKLFMDLIGRTNRNAIKYKIIMDIYYATLKAENYFDFNEINLVVTDIYNKTNFLNAHTWLKNWDNSISKITKNSDTIFKDENKKYIKQIYNNYGVKGLARYFWLTMYSSRIDDERLSHVEAFVGTDEVKKFNKEIDNLFSKYNFKLFMVAQAVIFAKAYFINGNTQNSNNASDLLHLLYLNENDKFVSNDKIYQTISEACPEFELIFLNNQKKLSDLF